LDIILHTFIAIQACHLIQIVTFFLFVVIFLSSEAFSSQTAETSMMVILSATLTTSHSCKSIEHSIGQY